MGTNTRSDTVKAFLATYLLPVVQLLLGGVFLFSGFVKALDPAGAVIKLDDYATAFGLTIIPLFTYLTAFLQAAFEFALGAFVLLGLYKRLTAWLVLLFMGIMTPFTLYLALANPVSDCGCFGEAITLTNWETFGKNVVLFVFSVFFYLFYARTWTLFGHRTSRWAATWVVLFPLLIAIHAYRHQPMIDFRPFKPGTDLRALTTAVPDSFSYSFIYEKEGIRQPFTIDQLPASDEGWTYVDRSEQLVKAGKSPVIDNLAILHPDAGDITASLLADTSYVFLYVADKLETADRRRVPDAREAYAYAHTYGYAFYGLTASDQTTIDEWRYEYDTPFEFCTADDRLLTTMTRSNPGLILIKNGVVLRKWAYRDIPEFASLDKPLYESSIGQPRHRSLFRVLGLSLLVFLFPLLYFHQLHTGRLARLEHHTLTSSTSV
ncbi:MAG: hypothetical protein BWY72_01963 [Bacteroidetes bacterium ADurb.Bin416]|nr:MAG: hypothetical protein BWY72_01963 [Bacteroidetes bacterium ADurb.Bin416]